MRVNGALSAFLSVCVLALICTPALADDAHKQAQTKKLRGGPSPARPSGIPFTPDPGDAYYGGPKLDTITETVNELGQTVYSIRASHFDISPPLRDMAKAPPRAAVSEAEEAPTNPQLPAARIPRSDFPDPVVQAAPTETELLAGGKTPLAAPTTGFNFLGTGINGGTPSDSNGSVGGNQFVEIVNTRYQVWSLNRSTLTATSVLGPVAINTLWSGFGGACEMQNSGDPTAIYDKVAKRWLLSQFTSSAAAGVYYQCVAVSTTSDATGAYARFAFAVPQGKFGDYPHFGVWPPTAYFMMAHGFGGQFAAIFAAMDRTKMIAGNSTATWLVILDPTEGGHMPADMDGFAYPPTATPGVFVSLHPDGMYIYRMKVSFAGSGSATRTLQAIVPTAPANAACGGGTCIPQPSSMQRLDAISDRLMFRAAYRNFIDHESLVVSHAVDPAVAGVVSGVRWYDIRLSGNPDATCSTYPCMYQQGTIADDPGGRSRWMSSLAMDSAENILVGYSTTGQTNGVENHSIRYTGRAKGDPPGTMTAPESTVVTGTANNGNNRWGDYSSMSSDPADDCTFWYVNQYFTSASSWSTRVASAAFPSGTGAGQCNSATCNNRPSATPGIGSASATADNQITVSWGAVVPTPGGYTIERADGACGGEGLYRALGAVAGTSTNFVDTNVLGGLVYSYRVRTAADATGRCDANLANPCFGATATGSCNLKPGFAGASGAASAQQSSCGINVSWSPASAHCPLTPNLRYSVFRGTVPEFTPSLANRIATCVPGPAPYTDTDNVASGTSYFYVVRAEDSSTGNGGECGGGNEESNSAVVSAAAYAAGTQSAPGTWMDGGGDTTAFMRLNVQTSGDTPNPEWRFVKTADDPGANHTPSGAYAYRNAGPGPGNTYATASCTEVQTPSVTAAGSTVNLEYWERHQLEYHWDGVAVEYSVNGGAWIDVPAPSNSPADGCDPADDTTGWEPLTCSQGSGANTCGFPDTKNVFTGPYGAGSTCLDFATAPSVTSYAHRCHAITGLNPGDSINFRWRASSDGGVDYAGFYLDDVAVTNVRLPNVCVPNICPGQPDGAACDDGNNCSINDACASGTCAGTPIFVPGETQNVRVQADKQSYIWDPMPNSPQYDVIRGALGAFPVGPGGDDETCFDDLAAAVISDATLPAPSAGFWYLSRAENACGIGTYGQQTGGIERTSTTCP